MEPSENDQDIQEISLDDINLYHRFQIARVDGRFSVVDTELQTVIVLVDDIPQASTLASLLNKSEASSSMSMAHEETLNALMGAIHDIEQRIPSALSPRHTINVKVGEIRTISDLAGVLMRSYHGIEIVRPDEREESDDDSNT